MQRACRPRWPPCRPGWQSAPDPAARQMIAAAPASGTPRWIPPPGRLPWALRMACVMGVVAQSAAAAAQSVVFINPGRSDERYWTTVSEAMQDAASSLGMQLQVRYAQRDHLRPIEIARQIAALPKRSGPLRDVHQRLQRGARNPAHAGGGRHRQLHGLQWRARDIAWPDRRGAGALSPLAGQPGAGRRRGRLPHGQGLVRRRASGHARAADGRLHMVAIAGDRSTPSSVERNAGMRRAAEPATWCCSRKSLANGAANAPSSRRPCCSSAIPKCAWCGPATTKWPLAPCRPGARAGSARARCLLQCHQFIGRRHDGAAHGELSALAGGHFLTGAWALVMLYDHAHGSDFATEGLEQVRPMFALLTSPRSTATSTGSARPWLRWTFAATASTSIPGCGAADSS